MSLSEFIIAISELIDAQFEDMRNSLHKSMQSATLTMLASLTALVGLVFALIGANMLLSLYFGKIAAYFLTALIAFLVTLMLLLLASKKVRK